MAWLAAAFAAGIALEQLGAPLPPAPALLLLLLPPIRAFLRPRRVRIREGLPRSAAGFPPPAAVLAAAAAGVLVAGAHEARLLADCRFRLPEGPVGVVTGRFLGRAGEGGAPFRLERAAGSGCRAEVRAYPPRGVAPPAPGVRLRAEGRWRRARRPDPLRPGRAGYLVLDDVRVAPAGGGGLRARALRLRGGLQARLARLYPDQAALVEALTLARKERLDPGLRDAFARAGVAHLLAISGFHVGVVAGVLLLLAGLAGVGPALRPAAAAPGVWAYVLGIGAPDAALRAAVILTLLAAGRLRRRPVVPLGALATALVALLLADPGALARPGFQLSFAGTAGLLLWTRRLRAALERAGRGRLPGWLTGGLAAGTAATVATLPLVAWHFGRASLVGIPATLAAAPVVGLALPGVAATLLLDLAHSGAAAFLAGGVELLLCGVVRGVERTAALPFASAWVPRSWVVLGCAAALAAAVAGSRIGGLGGRARRTLVAAAVASAVLLAPALADLRARGSVEIVALDVGQGDALALRSPGGRWILVDAGPRTPTFDAGSRIVVPYLRSRGAARLEALVLTHPDLDHIGGAGAVLASLEVGGVLDPARASGRSAYGRVLEAARARGVGWWPAADRARLSVDGMALTVLSPPGPDPPGPAGAADSWSNDASVVLLVEYGRFRALLTGDAPVAVERAVLGRVPGPLSLLKVGHHGSRTSTSRALVEGLRPEVAVIPVGGRNRYGHPHPEVLARLAGAGARVLRTDRDGTVVVRGRRDGGYDVALPDAR